MKMTVAVLVWVVGVSCSGCGPKPIKDYYESGKLQAEGFSKNGKLEGIYKTYHENGYLKSQAFFRRGRLDGFFKSYYENGKIEMESFFRNGTPEGAIKAYDERGKLKSAESVKDILQEATEALLAVEPSL
mgnify:CR=1 FL=1